LFIVIFLIFFYLYSYFFSCALLIHFCCNL
jgi:hypothetical protein